MTTNERQQRMAERILEDETLRGDLEDNAATALVDWASTQAAAAAADPARSDAVVEVYVHAIRQAARAAALSGETEPKQLIVLAAAELAPSQDATKVEPPAAENAAPPSNMPVVAEAPAPVLAATPAALATSAPLIEQPSDVVPKPTKPGGPRPRRKRSRLARFFKHLLSGR